MKFLDAFITLQTPVIASIRPTVIDVDGGSVISITGERLSSITSVSVSGVPCTDVAVISEFEVRARTPAVRSLGLYTVTVAGAEGTATSAKAIEAWTPKLLNNPDFDDVHVFDARDGITTSGEAEKQVWTRLTANIGPRPDVDARSYHWRARDGAMDVYHPPTKKFWMLGGWNGDPPNSVSLTRARGWGDQQSNNEVWSSPDGVAWNMELPDDPNATDRFSIRHFFGYAVWKDKIWIVGGDYTADDRTSFHTDVWSSSDGYHWDLEVSLTPWSESPLSPRMFTVVGVYDDKLWLFGGQNCAAGFFAPGYASLPTLFFNDVWCSENGTDWTCKLEFDPEADPEVRPTGRGVTNELVEFNGRMWLVTGGRYEVERGPFSSPKEYDHEVWSTSDGENWTKHPIVTYDAGPPESIWKPRIYHSMKVFDGKMFLFSGYNGTNITDLWWTRDGSNWMQSDQRTLGFRGGHADGTAVGPDGKYMIYAAGNYTLDGSEKDQDAWRLDVHKGKNVMSWTSQTGETPLVVAAPTYESIGGAVAVSGSDRRPLLVEDGLNGGPALLFDQVNSFMDLTVGRVEQPRGRSVIWIGHMPSPKPVIKPAKSPTVTVVGDSSAGTATSATGIAYGSLCSLTYQSGDSWPEVRLGSGYCSNLGQSECMGIAHDASGSIVGYVGGQAIGGGALPYPIAPDPVAWRTIGAAGGSSYKAFGLIGSVIVMDRVATSSEMAKIAEWSRGRFGSL